MKSIFKYLPVIALAVAATACDDLIDDKSVIDGKYAVSLPTVEFQNLKVVNYSTIEVTYTFSSISGVADAGIQVASDATFEKSSWLSFSEIATSATTIVSDLSPDTKYFARVFFSTNDGTVFSDSKEFSTPSVPLTSSLLVDKVYKASSVEEYFGKIFDFELSFETVEGSDYAVKINNLEPYFASNGFTADKGKNIFEGTLDPETGIITVPAGQAIGYQDVALMAFDDADPDVAEEYDDLYIEVINYGASIRFVNAWGMLSSGGWYSIYYGGLTLKP